MYNNGQTRQYMQFIQGAGFKYSKDDLGYYFDNGVKKFSIMKTGPIFNCFYNIKVEGSWTLKTKSLGVLQFDMCLQWVINMIQQKI